MSTEFEHVTNGPWLRSTVIDKFMRAGRYQKVLSLSSAKEPDEVVKDSHLFVQTISAAFLLGDNEAVDKFSGFWRDSQREPTSDDVEFLAAFKDAEKTDAAKHAGHAGSIRIRLKQYLTQTVGLPLYELTGVTGSPSSERIETSNCETEIATRIEDDEDYKKAFGLLSNAFQQEKSLQVKKELAMFAFTYVVNAVDDIQSSSDVLKEVAEMFLVCARQSPDDWRIANNYAAVLFTYDVDAAKVAIDNLLSRPGIPEQQIVNLRSARGACVAFSLGKKEPLRMLRWKFTPEH
ncbi:hypothetical protein KF913_08970 [Candidatus Obscuribacterales bacterium]|nr:hypothetical protein [Candidatus Obscuribacterales bacterium]